MDNTFLLFTLDGYYFGVGIDEIVRVYPALEIEQLSDGPELLRGLFMVAGAKIPVLDLRRRLRLPEVAVSPDNVLVVGRRDGVDFAFFVDSVPGVHAFSEAEICDSHTIYPDLAGHIKQIAEFSGKTVWIYTLAALFTEADFPALMATVANASTV